MNHLAGQSESEIRMETMISPSRAVIYVFTEVGKREMEEEEEEEGGGKRWMAVRAGESEVELAQDSLSGGRKKISNVCSA